MISLINFKQYLNFSLKDYQKYQLKKIINFVDYIKSRSLYYQKVLKPLQKINTFKDFYRIPLLEQNSLRDKPIDFIRSAPWDDIATVTRSSGSTGKSKIVLWTREAIKEEQKWGSLGYLIQNIKPEDRVAVIMPFEMTRIYSHVIALQNIGAFVVPIGRLRTDVDIDNAIEKIKLLGVTHLKATPSRILQIFKRIKELGGNLKKDFRIKCVLTGGQILTTGLRNMLSENIDGDVYDEMGANEFSFIGFECSYHDGLHILPEPNYVEVVDINNLKPITDNESLGEIIITSFINKGTPLLRYKLGDFGIINYKKCRCGLAFPRLMVKGRTVGTIIIGGTKLYAFDVEKIMTQFFYLNNNYQVVTENIGNKTKVTFGFETNNLNLANKQKTEILNLLKKASATIYDKIMSNKVIFTIEFLQPETLQRGEGGKIKLQYLDKREINY